MSVVNAGTLVVTLEGKDVNLSELINKVENQMQRGAATAKNFDNTIASLTATEKRNESALSAYAQAQARFAEASGNSNLAVQRLVSAMQALTPNTAAANNVLSQLQGTLNRQAAAATQAAAAQVRANNEVARSQAQAAAQSQKSLSAVTNFAGSFQKLIGAYFVATQAADAFASAIRSGNELEKAQASFRALSGDAANYEKNLAAARAQQDRFGGSLQENIEGLSGFANLARRTGIDINELANTARALAIVDPAQGFKGASIALKEFFSGDITSLARRFEIPRDRLNELKELAANDAPAAFEKLQGVLAEFGISQSLLEGQANTTAVAYDKLSGSAADAFASIGQGLAELLKGPATALGTKLQEVAAGITALNQSGDQKLAIETSLISTATSADAFNTKIAEINQALVSNVGIAETGIPVYDALAQTLANVVISGLKFEEMTDSQLRFAQAALQSGVSLNTIKAAITGTTESVASLDAVFQQFPERINGTAAELQVFQLAMQQAAATGANGVITANAFAEAVLVEGLSVEEATARLQGYIVGIEATNAAKAALANAEAAALDQHERAAGAIDTESTALGEQAIKSQQSAIQADLLAQLQADLARLGPLAASGHISAANAAEFLASKYNLAAGEALALVDAQAKLAGANAAATGTGKGKGVSRGGIIGDIGGAQTKKNVDDLLKKQQDLLQSEANLAKAKGNTGEAIAKLREAQKGLNKDSKAYIDLETKIQNLQNQADKAGKPKGGGGGAKSPKLTAQEKLHNQLLAGETKFDQQMQDLEEGHQQKLLDIIKDFNKKQLEVQQQNEVLRRRSRFDFYSDLNKSQLSPIDREAFAAAYESAFAKAQEIAQSGRAKLAQEFLALKQQHIAELKELAEEEADIRGDKDLSGGEKKARLAELEARRKLLQDAQREEEKQLLEGGDKVHNELNDRIAEENKAYEDQADKIITAADRAGEAKIRNAENSKIAVDAETLALAQQYEQYKKIADLNGGTLPATARPTTADPATAGTPPGTPAPITAPDAIPIKTDTPLAIQPPEALTVKQFELFLVRDQGVIDALGDQTIRLEGALTNLGVKLDNMNTSLGGKLDSLARNSGNKQNLVTK